LLLTFKKKGYPGTSRAWARPTENENQRGRKEEKRFPIRAVPLQSAGEEIGRPLRTYASKILEGGGDIRVFVASVLSRHKGFWIIVGEETGRKR